LKEISNVDLFVDLKTAQIEHLTQGVKDCRLILDSDSSNTATSGLMASLEPMLKKCRLELADK